MAQMVSLITQIKYTSFQNLLHPQRNCWQLNGDLPNICVTNKYSRSMPGILESIYVYRRSRMRFHIWGANSCMVFM